jgi:hypothetical protein
MKTQRKSKRAKKLLTRTISKPDKRELKASYKALLTTDTDLRVQALAKALHWYDALLDWAQNDTKKSKRLSVDSLKLVNLIFGLRQRANDTQDLKIKEESLIDAIRHYETILKGAIKTKSVSLVYEKLKKVVAKIKKKEDRLTSKHQKTLTLLQEILKPRNHKGVEMVLKITPGAIKERGLSSDFRALGYSKEKAETIAYRIRLEGILPVVHEEITPLALLGGSEWDEEKQKFIPDFGKQLIAFKYLWGNVIEYAKANPKLARKFVRVKRSKRRKKGRKA